MQWKGFGFPSWKNVTDLRDAPTTVCVPRAPVLCRLLIVRQMERSCTRRPVLVFLCFLFETNEKDCKGKLLHHRWSFVWLPCRRFPTSTSTSTHEQRQKVRKTYKNQPLLLLLTIQDCKRLCVFPRFFVFYPLLPLLLTRPVERGRKLQPRSEPRGKEAR